MDDPVLMSRIEALRNRLDVVSANLDSAAWQRKPAGATTRAELLGASALWTGLESTLNKPIRNLQLDLDDVEDGLCAAAQDDQAAAAAAWQRYTEILGHSQEILRECLEIIGTLAIREKDMDHQILYVADELVLDCLTSSTGDPYYYLLVHGLSDTFSKTRARIIRLRFPEWTLWDLPLAAHELGHVVIGAILAKEKENEASLRLLTPFLHKQRDLLVAQDVALLDLHRAPGGALEAERYAEGRVRVLLADAFATYTIGPAYACSAIMLRLSPAVAAQRDTPSDAQRAQVVLSMLRWMNAHAPGISRPYTDIIGKLEANWATTLGRGRADGSPGEDEPYLDRLAGMFAEMCPRILNVTAMYPHAARNEGFARAREWAGAWLEQWQEGRELDLPRERAGKLRDVLNATWLCRLSLGEHGPDGARRAHAALGKVGQALCAVILAPPERKVSVRSRTFRPQGA